MSKSEFNNGRIVGLAISKERGTKKGSIEFVRLVENSGIEGDAHRDSYREVSLLSIEERDKIALKKLHLQEAILVLDVDGYIGKESREEIEYFKTLANKIDNLVNRIKDPAIKAQVSTLQKQANSFARQAQQKKNYTKIQENYRKAIKLLLRAQSIIENKISLNNKLQTEKDLKEIASLLERATKLLNQNKKENYTTLITQARKFYEKAKNYYQNGQFDLADQNLKTARNIINKTMKSALLILFAITIAISIKQ